MSEANPPASSSHVKAPTLEAMVDYMVEQDFIPKKIAVDDLSARVDEHVT